MPADTHADPLTATSYDVPTVDPELIRHRTDELVRHAKWSRAELLSEQGRMLREMLQHAAANSPYYKHRIGELVARGAPLPEFPTTNKQILMAEFDGIVTDPRLNRALVEAHIASGQPGRLLLDEYRVAATGGTSGMRGIFVYDQNAWETAVANFRRNRQLLGQTEATRALSIGAPSPVHLSNRFAAENRVGRRGAPRLSVTTPLPRIVAELNAYQPETLATYPSFMRVLAEEQRSRRLHISPFLVFSIAEALSPDVRDLVRATWGVEIMNNYAATETAIIANDCRHATGLHVYEDLLVVEIVDAANRPVPVGTQGSRTLITTLFNRTLPLIRYEFSDLLTAVPGTCPCGSPFMRIRDIEGRHEEMLHVWNERGHQVDVHAARLWFHLVRVAGIRQYQFVQLPAGIAVRIVVQSGHAPDEVRESVERIAGSALHDLGVAGGRIEVRIVDHIERVGTGLKQKPVVSEARA